MNNTELLIINRITLLKSRGRENGNIIKKLERQLRKMRGDSNDRT